MEQPLAEGILKDIKLKELPAPRYRANVIKLLPKLHTF